MALEDGALMKWLTGPTLRTQIGPGVMTTSSVVAGGAIGYLISPLLDGTFGWKFWVACGGAIACGIVYLIGRRWRDGAEGGYVLSLSPSERDAASWERRHGDAVGYMHAHCVEQFDVSIPLERVPHEAQILVAEKLAKSVLDTKMSSANRAIRSVRVAVHANLDLAFVMGRVLGDLRHEKQVRLVYTGDRNHHAPYAPLTLTAVHATPVAGVDEVIERVSDTASHDDSRVDVIVYVGDDPAGKCEEMVNQVNAFASTTGEGVAREVHYLGDTFPTANDDSATGLSAWLGEAIEKIANDDAISSVRLHLRAPDYLVVGLGAEFKGNGRTTIELAQHWVARNEFGGVIATGYQVTARITPQAVVPVAAAAPPA